MSYEPRFTITPELLGRVEAIAALRERIQGAALQVAWIPALQKDTAARNAHSSTAIEGNPLTLEEVRALHFSLPSTDSRLLSEETHPRPARDGYPGLRKMAKDQGLKARLYNEGRGASSKDRSRREVMNYFAALRTIEKRAGKARLVHGDILRLHAILAGEVMDQGEAGCYRTIRVRVGPYVPPPPGEVSGLMFELLEWWNKDAPALSPVLSSSILHYRFEAIHPFADGNGRAGRALALWELYRRGFDSHHIFSVDEFYWEDRPRYYAALQAVRREGEELTSWLEYCAEGLQQTLERVEQRIRRLSASQAGARLVLRPKQEQLLNLIRARGGLSPREIWDALVISKQGAINLLNPLIEAGLVERVGTHKNGRYVLK
jgi:Fic family protein